MQTIETITYKKFINPTVNFLINCQYNVRASEFNGRIVGVVVAFGGLVLSCVAPLLLAVERIIRIAGNIFGKLLYMKSCSFKNVFQHLKEGGFVLFISPFIGFYQSLKFGALSVIDPKNVAIRTFGNPKTNN